MHLNIYIYIYIYKETKLDNQINDKNTVMQNTLFYVIVQKDDKKQK
jgi:hypothetical protein